MRHESVSQSAVALLFTLVALTIAVGPTAGPADANHADDASVGTFAVAQPDACYEVSPHGDGTEPVDHFYDYRPGHGYSSAGTTDLQAAGVSNLFVYHGPAGVSLVFLHGAHGEGAGGVVSMAVEGLPADAEWVVEDDDYPERDDEFAHAGTRSDVHWRWGPERTDGGAVRGLGTNATVVVDPSFNHASPSWDAWPFADETGRVETWRLPAPDGDTVAELDPAAPVAVSAGTCDATAPVPSLTVDNTTVEPGEPVTFDAANTTTAAPVQGYRWDVDGDGTVDRVTDEPRVTHTYRQTGTADATVAVVDAQWNAAVATVAVSVRNDTERRRTGRTTPTDTAGRIAPMRTGFGGMTDRPSATRTGPTGVETGASATSPLRTAGARAAPTAPATNVSTPPAVRAGRDDLTRSAVGLGVALVVAGLCIALGGRRW